jgi:hypothetical protein
MNKKNIFYIALLGVLIVILLLSKGRENIEKRTDLFRFRTTEISKIEFVTSTDTLSIVQQGDIWMITHPREIPARETQIQRFFDEFLTLTISRNAVSDSPSRHEFYNVDEDTGLQVSLYDRSNRLLRRVFYGRNDQNPQIAYVRIDRDNNVYQINNIFHIINPMLQAWREDRIVTFTQNDLLKVSVSNNTGAFEVSQELGFWTVSIDLEVDIIQPTNNEFNRFINAVTNLRSSVFFDDVFAEHAAKFATPELEVLIETTTGEIVHLAIAQNDANSFVLQRNGDETTLYRLTNAQFNNLNVDATRMME